jgi:dienelactone hydrolase
MYPQAIEFARRGYAVLVVMRRGYGDSVIPYAESSGRCDARNYMVAAQASRQDLAAAVAAVKSRADISTERMIAVGQSAGGFASIAYAATTPAGLAAVINFAGGRGSRSVNDVCEEPRLIEAFSQMGKTARVPMLWIYSENDLYFRPALSRQFHAVFTKSGGAAEFVMVPAFGQDGHSFFARGVSQWTPIVDRFLTAQGLMKDVRPAPKVAAIPPPPQLSPNGKQEFARYLAGGPSRAFAVSPKGAFGFRMGTRSVDEARKLALENCAKHAKDCAVYAVDDVLEKPVR